MLKIEFKKITEDAIIPIKKNSLDAGFDFFTNESKKVYPGSTEMIRTGIAYQIICGFSDKHNSGNYIANFPSFLEKEYNNMFNIMDLWFVKNFNFFSIVTSRSSAMVKGIHTSLGIIDESYTGEVKIVVNNLSKKTLSIEKGKRIAQVCIIPFLQVKEIEVVSEFSTLPVERGNEGFGSTGE